MVDAQGLLTLDPLIKSQLLLQGNQRFKCKTRQKRLFQINWIRVNCKTRFGFPNPHHVPENDETLHDSCYWIAARRQ